MSLLLAASAKTCQLLMQFNLHQQSKIPKHLGKFTRQYNWTDFCFLLLSMYFYTKKIFSLFLVLYMWLIYLYLWFLLFLSYILMEKCMTHYFILYPSELELEAILMQHNKGKLCFAESLLKPNSWINNPISAFYISYVIVGLQIHLKPQKHILHADYAIGNKGRRRTFGKWFTNLSTKYFFK